MIDYVGRTQSVGEAGIPWNQWIGGMEENRQREWGNQYLRDTVDRQNRATRAINAGDLQDWQANAGLFDNRNSIAQNLHRQNNPTIGPRMEMFPEPAANAGMGGTAGGPTDTGFLTQEQQDRLAPGAPQAPRAPRPTVPVLTPREMTPEQSRAWANYLTVTRVYNPGTGRQDRLRPNVDEGKRREAIAALRTAGIDLSPTGQPVRLGAMGTEARDTGDPAALVGLNTLPDDQANQTQSEAPAAPTPGQTAGISLGQLGGDTAETDPTSNEYYQGTNDTSHPLQPTPEMRATDLIVQTSFRHAQTYAQYGMTEQAQQSITQAVQGQATYWQQENNQLLRAFGVGNVQAGAALIARFNGYEPSDVRIRQTQEGRPRNVLEFRDEQDPNTWRAAFELPQSREQLYYQLEQLADATSARARAEITQHNIENLRQQQVQLTIASWEAQNRFLQTMTEAQTAQMRMATDRAVAAGGRPQIAQDGNGSLFLVYPELDAATGRVTQTVEVLRVGEHRTANVDGENQTVDGPYRTRLPN